MSASIYERPRSLISDITDKKDFWKLAVKVKDKWTVIKDGKEHLELVIVDAKGNEIQLIIPTGYKAMYDKILQENNTYTLSNFNVQNNNLAFKACDHKYLLKWTGGTTADDVNRHTITSANIKFKPFAEILSGKWKADLLVHVIGLVQDIGYCQLTEGTGKKLQVNFTMKDLSDISLNCTLWEEYAGRFIRFSNERKETGPVVVMLKYCKIKEEGRYPLSVSNTYSFTKLYINDDIDEIKLFRDSLPKDDVVQSQSQLMCTQSSSSSQFTSEDDLLTNTMVLPLSHVIQLDQISYCVTVAKIEKVNSTKNGWYYFACHKCPKIAKGDKPPYTCEDGHNTETEIVRYKLEFDVSDALEKATFVVWDREVTQMLGVSAAQLRTNMIQAGITNRFEYPLMMDGLAEKTMVFKVKWQPRWKSCSVVTFKDSPAFVAQVRAKFQDYQAPAPPIVDVDILPMVQDNVGDKNVDDDYVILSANEVSGSADFDPETLSQLTPPSNLKHSDTSKNWDALSQLTPTSNYVIAELSNEVPESLKTPAQQKPTDAGTLATAHQDLIPPKQSSSKRVKLIKQEKK